MAKLSSQISRTTSAGTKHPSLRSPFFSQLRAASGVHEERRCCWPRIEGSPF